MSEINANIVVEQVNLGLTADNNNINITPNDIQLNIYTAGGSGSTGAGGNNGQLQYNNLGVLGGVPNTSVTSGNLRFTNIGNLKINGGSNAYFLQTDGSGNLTWAAGTGNITGNASAAGANNQIQLSTGTGNFKVGSGFSFDPASNILTVPGDTYSSNFIGTFANGTSNVAIPTANSNVNITVNGNVSAVISDSKITTPSLRVNSGNVTIGNSAGANSQSGSGIAIGSNAGYDLQAANGIAIGTNAANLSQGISAIAIGTNAGISNQGQYSIAIGHGAGNVQSNNSIVINATGNDLPANQSQALYVKPIRNSNTGNVLFYDVTTGEISYDLKPSTSNISNGTSNVNIPTSNGNVIVGVNGSNIATFSTAGMNVTGNGTFTGNVTAQNLIGNVIGNFTGIFANGTSNIDIPVANGNINFSVNGNANRFIVKSDGANVTGNLGVSTLLTANSINATAATIVNANITTQANIANLTITAGNGIALGNGASVGSNILSSTSVAVGAQAVANSIQSVAVGYGARGRARGTAVGYGAGGGGTAGLDNTFIGQSAGAVGNANVYGGSTFVGSYAGSRQDGQNNIAVGYAAGMGSYANGTIATGQSGGAIAVGAISGRTNQQANAIAIGYLAADNNQGTGSIAIGTLAGNNQAANSITIDATNSGLSANIANALFVKPIRDVTGVPGFTVQLYYNPTTGEIGYK